MQYGKTADIAFTEHTIRQTFLLQGRTLQQLLSSNRTACNLPLHRDKCSMLLDSRPGVHHTERFKAMCYNYCHPDIKSAWYCEERDIAQARALVSEDGVTWKTIAKEAQNQDGGDILAGQLPTIPLEGVPMGWYDPNEVVAFI